MSVTLTGPIVIENMRPVDGSRCVILNARIYVSPDHTLTGRFHFFNTASIKFANVGHYFTWIHVGTCRFTPAHSLVATRLDDAGHVEDLSEIAAKFNICGDIVCASGTFAVSAAQYTSSYPTPTVRNLSAVPVIVHSDGVRYNGKKPMPSANTFVSVKGFVTRFDVAEGFLAVVDIHVLVDNIAFLGKANIAPPPDKPAASSPAGPSRFAFNFGGLPPPDAPSPTPSLPALSISGRRGTPQTCSRGRPLIAKQHPLCLPFLSCVKAG
ncbi:hypothetical protein BC826DRAFT_973491 [Russula brevipes]|nr:hypothetical protein BC826DRAFT_973491 [Russula brevipes]